DRSSAGHSCRAPSPETGPPDQPASRSCRDSRRSQHETDNASFRCFLSSSEVARSCQDRATSPVPMVLLWRRCSLTSMIQCCFVALSDSGKKPGKMLEFGQGQHYLYSTRSSCDLPVLAVLHILYKEWCDYN